MRFLSPETRQYPLRYVKAVLRHLGPEFWIVSTFPFYISYVWASGEIFPGWEWLGENSAHAGEYWSHFVDYLHVTWEFWLGVIIAGPLLGGGTILYSDYFDAEIDKQNPRKVRRPWYKVPATPGSVMGGALFLFVLSLVLSTTINPQFFAISTAIIVLAILYSTPPVRWKARGGMDLVTNMVGFGTLCSFAGFVVAGDLADYPWLWQWIMLSGMGCLYVLTTIADMEADGESGVPTIAVKLGFEGAVKLSMVLLLIANVGIITLGLMDYLYSPGVVLRVWPISVAEFVPLMYMLYHRDIDVIMWVIFITGSLMAIGTFLLALNHVGIWVV
jgi:4-hydroxybenzoate polyprenyltransferase